MEVDSLSVESPALTVFAYFDESVTPNRRRETLPINSLSHSVADLKNIIRAKFSLGVFHHVDIIYCGKLLNDDAILEKCGIGNRSCLNVMVKDMTQPAASQVSSQEVVQALSKLMNPAYRSAVDSVFANTALIYDIIASCPDLQKDILAQVIVKDLSIINVLANPENVERVLKLHPSLASAALKIYDLVMERISKHGALPSSSSGTTYALDQMSDEEEEPHSGQPVPPNSRAPHMVRITSNQLAEALAMVQSSNTPIASSSAAQSATGTMSSLPSQSRFNALPDVDRPPDVSSSYESQMQQLRDMGIVDERVALEALRAAGGNIHVALEIIYGGNL